MLATLNQIFKHIESKNCAVAAFNVFGYEDARAVVEAAEEIQSPVILATNKVAIEHMSIKHLAALLRSIAEDAKVPVCIHLDHGKDYATVAKAIFNGYTSVMYDGSQLPLRENIQNTSEIVKLAHSCGISVEAEIGSVGYSDPTMNVKEISTNPIEAKQFAEETAVDALAVAVGTLHRMENQTAVLQFDRLEEIKRLVPIPLVIHGSTGVPDQDLSRLPFFNVRKVNIGTALRMKFGKTLREEMEKNPSEFDRINLFKQPMKMVQEEAKRKLQLLGLGTTSLTR